MKNNILHFIFFLAGLFSLLSCSGRGKLDLSNATPLLAEPVAEPTPPKVPLHPLFSFRPGEVVDLKTVGTIDPVGTSILNDFDGDGILNVNETTTNPMVADYPQINSSISTPVTMQIEVLTTSTNETTQLVSEITSEDFENTRDTGSEKIHQNEIITRTDQVQDSLSTHDASSSASGSGSGWGASMGAAYREGGGKPAGKGDSPAEQRAEKTAGGGTTYGASFGMSKSSSNGSSHEEQHDMSQKVTKWATIPYKNNIDSDAWWVRTDSAAKNAHQYLVQKNKVNIVGTEIKPDAGYVRAALYIRNRSNNMPVRLSNILASLVFETPSGDVVPVQSFRLRNDDYSLFSVNVYGGQQFGPYVIELKNLNRAEIEKAILYGYNPKIHIVDYEMTHVPDSNYRSTLLNYPGDNLKIVEENAKGRTAMVRIFAPGARAAYRVAAFSIVGQDPNACALPTTYGAATPGVSLTNALKRLGCSGNSFETETYLIDLSDFYPGIKGGRFVFKGIKAVGSVRNRVPCDFETNLLTGVKVCKIRPFASWTDEERLNFGMWVVYADGSYFAHSDYEKNSSGGIKTYEGLPYLPDQNIGTPMTKGVDSTVWAGDTYDLTFMSFYDFLRAAGQFGTNPIDTNAPFSVNTKWNKSEFNRDNPYDPETKAMYLGMAGLGDTVELSFNLRKSQLLNPNFGADKDPGPGLEFSDFTYNRQTDPRRFSIDEAINFEINLGLGGDANSWENVLKPSGAASSISLAGKSVNYATQTYRVRIKLPASHPLANKDGLVQLFLRPSLNNAHRISVWPEDYQNIKRLKAELSDDVTAGTNAIFITNISGNAEIAPPLADRVHIISQGVDYSYMLSGPIEKLPAGKYRIPLSTGVNIAHAKADKIHINGYANAPTISWKIDQTAPGQNAFQEWNVDHAVSPNRSLLAANSVDCSQVNAPPTCYGTASSSNDYLINNWLGNQSIENSWVDADSIANNQNKLNFFPAPMLSTTNGKNSYLKSLSQTLAFDTSHTGDNLNYSQYVAYFPPRIVARGDYIATAYFNLFPANIPIDNVMSIYNQRTGKTVVFQASVQDSIYGKASHTVLKDSLIEISSDGVYATVRKIENPNLVSGIPFTTSVIGQVRWSNVAMVDNGDDKIFVVLKQKVTTNGIDSINYYAVTATVIEGYPFLQMDNLIPITNYGGAGEANNGMRVTANSGHILLTWNETPVSGARYSLFDFSGNLIFTSPPGNFSGQMPRVILNSEGYYLLVQRVVNFFTTNSTSMNFGLLIPNASGVTMASLNDYSWQKCMLPVLQAGSFDKLFNDAFFSGTLLNVNFKNYSGFEYDMYYDYGKDICVPDTVENRSQTALLKYLRQIDKNDSVINPGLVTRYQYSPNYEKLSVEVVDSRNLETRNFGVNNFFTAPLIERDYDVAAKLVFE